MENTITEAKLELMRKIVSAHLTKDELEEVSQYAISLIQSRPQSADSQTAV